MDCWKWKQTLRRLGCWALTAAMLFGLMPGVQAAGNETAPVFQSAKSYGGEATDALHDAAYTLDGGFVAMGYSFGESSDPAWTHTGSGNNNDAVLLKFDSAHKLQWSKAYGGDGVDVFNSIDVLKDGRIAALGRSSYTSDDESIKGVSWYLLVINPDNPDDYIDYRIGGASGDQGYAVAATSDGGFVAAGWSASKTGFVSSSTDRTNYSAPVQLWEAQDGTDSAIPNRIAASGSDSVVVKFNSAGETQFVALHNYGVSESANDISTPSERLESVAVDADDNIYLVGYDAVAKNAQNAVIAKLSGADGSLLWHRSAGRQNQTSAPENAAEYIKAVYDGVAVLKDNSVVVTGTSTGDATTEEGWKITGVKDTLVVRYGADGNLLFSDSFGTIDDNNSRPEGIIATPDGGYIVYGSQSGIMQEDALVAKGYNWGNYGGQDAILVKYSADNAIVWAENYGSNMGDWINGMAIRDDGEIIAVGESNGQNGYPAWGNHGGIDGVILCTNLYSDAYTEATETVADGNVVWADGSYTATGNGFGGADSVAVTVVIENERIASVTGESRGDSAIYYNEAAALHDTIAQQQTVNVDGVSGATYSSNGIKDAASKALGQSAAAYADGLIAAIATAEDKAAATKSAADAYAELGSYALSQLKNQADLQAAAKEYGVTLSSRANAGGGSGGSGGGSGSAGGNISETQPGSAGNLAHNDTYYKLQNQYYRNIQAEAFENNALDGDGVKIAVIDSGVNPSHQDLDYSRILEGYDYDSGAVMSRDSLTDNNGHGTAVTGILTAVADNGIGVAGLFSKLQVIPLKVSPLSPSKDEDGASSKTVAQAITDAVDKYQADVITTSLDVKDTDELAQAVAYAASKNVIITGASGNSSTSEADPYIYPASYDDVISVGAVDTKNSVRANSQKNDKVFVTAPGENIAVLDLSLSGRCKLADGTSYASPMVAAMAVAAKQYNKDITPAQFKQLLQTSSVDAGAAGYDTSYGYGIVNYDAFVSALKSMPEGSGGESGKPDESGETYVLMNIPYADFYAAELGADDMTADTVTSATLKASNSAIVGGSYHEGESSNILGVTYPVCAESASVLSAYKKADSEDALFSGGSYAYVPMSDAPANYKILTLDENGKASFGAVQSGTAKETLSAELNLTVLTRRGDYEITYRDEEAVKAISDSVVIGQILTASDGHKYAMRHLENIWENIEMALCTGHSDTIKNVNKEDALTPSQSGYAGLEGSTVTGITYYVKNAGGQYQTFEVSVNLPIPVYPSASFTDSRTIRLTGLPQADLETVRTVTKESPENEGTAKERFYAAYVTNQKTESPQPLVLTENPLSMEVSDDGAVIIRTENAAESGAQYAVRVIQDRTKRAVPDQLLLINANAVWNASGSSGTEEPQDTAQYVLMNIPYADFYAAELGDGAAAVDAVTSATKSKPRTSTLAGGSYHVNSDGSDISGVIYPVLVSDASALTGKTQITDDSSVSITVTNRGQEATTEYKGREALFESASYSYYTLNEKPDYYKILTVGADGALAFSPVIGQVTTAQGVTGNVTVGGRHTDIEIALTIPENDGIVQGAAVSGVVLTDGDGVKYALRHVVNIWRGTELGWNLGELDLSGKTISNIRYITQDAVYDYPVTLAIGNPGYVLMNIPYAEFYAAELDGGAVDAVTTATLKFENKSMAAGSYHVNDSATDEGSDLTGVTYPVFVPDLSALNAKLEVKATDKKTINLVTGREKTVTATEVEGQDILFCAPTYSWLRLTEKPVRYKTLTVENGAFAFGAVSGRAATVEDVSVRINYETHHGNDAEVILTGTGIESDAIVGGVILTDSDGVKYGLPHIQGIWSRTQLGWPDTSAVAGKTFTNVRFILRDSVIDCPVSFTVKPKMSGTLSATFTGARELTLSGLASDTKNAKVTVTYTTGERPNTETHTVADGVAITNGKVTLTEDSISGQAYTVTVVSDNYGDKSASVTASDTPSTPDAPDTPSTPDTPDKPDTPTTPDKPDTPTTPDNPDTPDTPAKPSKQSGGCYVATAVYGSYDCPEVWTLRRFRDEVLAETWYGRLFIRLYYAVSPTAVKLFGDTQLFQDFFRARLDTLVSDLQDDGFESTPYEDTVW